MKTLLTIALSLIITITLYAEDKKEETTAAADFTGETPGAEAKDFSAFVGKWHIDKDEENIVYAVDGRKWERGLMADGIAEKAKALYGKRYAEFLDNLQAYKYFPLSIYKKVNDLKNGTISVDFKAVSGRIDQGAGIAFNIKKNGDYLVIRANPLEQNMVLFKMEKGKRSSVQWRKDVPHKSQKWHTLKIVIDGNKVEGFLNGKMYITYEAPENFEGKIGLWSKSDSYVLFDNFKAVPGQ